jgi:predicted AlkP superfamily phosphohydrolase/phosphomutase
MDASARILLIGLDGATDRALGPLFGRGVLPNLAALWRRSCRGTLQSTLPMVTPVAWTSFLTGCDPGRHGIHEFFHLDAARRTFQANTSRRIRVDTLWHVLGAQGRSVVCVNLPMTYPAPAVPGLFIGGNDAPNHEAAIASCPEFARKLTASHPGFTTRNLWKSRPRNLAELERVLRKTEAQFEALAEAAIRADAQIDWTALMVQFQNLDGLQHRAWPELGLGDGPAPDPAAARAVERTLRALDGACGRLLDLAQRRGAAVIALSDHGFGPCRSVVNVNGLLQAGGFQRRLSYGTRFHYRFHRLRDRWRRWRIDRADEPLARMPRSIEGEVGCDWKRSVAFAPFGQLSACVYLHGAMGADTADALRTRAEIVEYLASVRHPDTGERLFREAIDLAEQYGCDPAREGCPDVLAGSVDGLQAQAKWDPRSKAITSIDPSLPGTHFHEGVVAIDAPGFAEGTSVAGRLADVAPTVLTLLGLAVPPSMEGRVLTAVDGEPNGEPTAARPRPAFTRVDGSWVPPAGSVRSTPMPPGPPGQLTHPGRSA